jgi:hypothetical protein
MIRDGSGLGQVVTTQMRYETHNPAAAHRAVMSIGPQERIRVARTHAEAKAEGVCQGPIRTLSGQASGASPGHPMISVVNDAIERTHRLISMSREEIVRRGIIRKEIPIYGLGAVAAPSLLGGLRKREDGSSSPSYPGLAPR